MTSDKAYKEDMEFARSGGQPFYAEEEDGDWFVFGASSGFAYESHSTECGAIEAATKKNEEMAF